jgi:hypothetical protein
MGSKTILPSSKEWIAGWFALCKTSRQAACCFNSIISLKSLVVALALAIIVSGGIAMVLAWQISRHPPPSETLDWGGSTLNSDRSNEAYSGWLVSRDERIGAIIVTSSWYDRGVSWGLGGGWPADPPEPLVPSWAAFATPQAHSPTNSTHCCVALAAGWPCLAFRGGMRVEWSQAEGTTDKTDDSDGESQLHLYSAHITNKELATRDPNSWQAVIVWPYGLLPFGFIANTLSYWLVFAALAAVYRRIYSRKYWDSKALH